MKGSEVSLTPPIIFACGGNADVRLPEPKSVRGFFIEHIVSREPELFSHIRIAENFKDWLNDSKYADLKTFEEDIAHISSLILIFLESPGTIAELGLFATYDNLIDKLIIFVSEFHYSSDSFIKLGLLRYLSGKNEDIVRCYPWDDNNLKNTAKSVINDISEDIKDLLSKHHKREVFQEENPGHISFVIFEIILLFKALKYNEIMDSLECLGLCISKQKLNRFLFLLEKLGFISKKSYGSEFYYPLQKQSRVSLSLKDKTKKIDKSAITMAAMQFYMQEPKERHRRRMLSSLLVSEDSGEKL